METNTEARRLLFLTNAELGQANVHLAVIEWLLAHQPQIELHLCSFASLRPAVAAINDAAGADTAAPRVTFHALSGAPWKECLFERPEHQWQEICALPPTAWSVARSAPLMPRVVLPWNADELVDLTRQVKEVVESVDAQLVIVDNLFTPGITVCYNVNPKWCVLSPNTYREFILGDQPRYENYWKHPPTSSFIPYPVPFYMIPSALYHQRQWTRNRQSTWIHENAVHLWEKTDKKIIYADWGRLSYDPPKDLKIFLPSNAIVDFPFSKIPDHIVSCGPILRPVATSLEEADPKLAAWLRRRPTVYINLGTHVLYDSDTQINLAGAIKALLEAAAAKKQDIQVLWKVNRDKKKEGSDHEALYKELGQDGDQDRVLIVDWLLAEPVLVLNSGSIVCSVNHGGANSYFEAVSAGVPQIVLPVWFDTYDFARRVEYFGIGKIGNRNNAPKCCKDELAPIFKQVVLEEAGKLMQAKATKMAEACKASGQGSEKAARGILELLEGTAA
ncbi:UDP-glucoronosyl and UDP-glucosyl transferase, putative [Cordyceps militaris CM01]|uniref:UDP-glucoronosyl and UDP-glucosyl transferase, putative n=1 Tax=Cordyceps militaris (strain CM01) TaxID=983644 RepID=G3JSW3_CORMM|nr:UDP-glucoronosyl and UDP-glucosyl transferase, putative [Cordyceps militaris CM01]EGX88959.1 UDP-glucoronosyl and UDP-glucosyl transferase, putative [Cordyceps militaris CM01]